MNISTILLIFALVVAFVSFFTIWDDLIYFLLIGKKRDRYKLYLYNQYPKIRLYGTDHDLINGRWVSAYDRFWGIDYRQSMRKIDSLNKKLESVEVK